MRVLYLIDTLEVGGAEKSLLGILSHFRHSEPIVCHLYRGNTLRAVYEQANISVISLDLDGRYAFRAAVRLVGEVVRSERPVLIHTTLFRSNIVGRIVGRFLDIPVVSTLVSESYGERRLRDLSGRARLKLRAVRLADAGTARWASHFVAISETAKQSGCRTLGLPSQKVTVIYRGRDPGQLLQVSDQQLMATRASLGTRRKGAVVLNVGRLLKSKGQRELIEAMATLGSDWPDASLLIAGEGDDRHELERRVNRLGVTGQVSLLGTRSDIPALLHLADVFAFPSHYEGHGGALVEAMFAGRPIIASDIPVLQESITHGQTGLLVPPENSQALAKGILWLLENPDEARQMGLRAREKALRCFDIGKIAAQHEELYEQVLQGRR